MIADHLKMGKKCRAKLIVILKIQRSKILYIANGCLMHKDRARQFWLL